MVRTPQTCAVHGRMVVAAYGRAKMLSPVCPRRVVFPLLPAPLSRCRGIADLLCTRSDYTNPIDLCNGLNKYIIPEVAIHAFLTFLFLINGYWLPLILNLPLVAWNAKKCVAPARTSGPSFQGCALTGCRIIENKHLLDATEIFRKLNVHKKVRTHCRARLGRGPN